MKTTLLITSLILFTAFTFAQVRFVSKTGSSAPPYTSWVTASDSIQKCIDYAFAGDTIYVGNGIYKEKIVVNNKFLTLIGSGWDSCTVDSRDLATPTDYHTIYIDGGANIEGFNIIVSNNQNGNGIVADNFGVNTFIQKNKITGARIGVWIFNSHLTCGHNLIVDVETGIVLEAFDENYFPVIDSNIIITAVTGNSAHGIRGSFGTSSYIRNNIIINENTGDGMIPILNPKEIKNNLVIQKGINNTIINYLGYYTSLGNGEILNNLLISNYAKTGFLIFRGSNKVYNNNMINGVNGYKVELPDSINLKYNNAWNVDTPFMGFIPDSSNTKVDPMVISEDSSDFHLQKYSPLIDAGDPNILDRDGSRSDIGLFGGPYGEKYTYRDLAPKPPANVSTVYENKSVKLTWNKNTEADFSSYKIYRDTVAHFIYDTTKIVGVTSDTTFLNNLPITTTAKNYYYLITAFDNTNHQSAPSEEVLVTVTGMNEVPPIVIESYKLLNNYPNPFNSSTIIPYRLKEGGYVKLYVYDTKGELVRILVNDHQNAGYYEVRFSPTENERKQGGTKLDWRTGYNDDVASGIYLYRLCVRGDGDVPVFTAMGKMILLK